MGTVTQQVDPKYDTPQPRTRCALCGRTSRRACGPALQGVCGLPDPRWLQPVESPLRVPNRDRFGDNPLNQSTEATPGQSRMQAARAALSKLARCGAYARTTGQPCKSCPMRGSTRCRKHGGRSTGAPPRSGKYTLRRARDRHFLSLMLGAVSTYSQKMAPVEARPMDLGRSPSTVPVLAED